MPAYNPSSGSVAEQVLAVVVGRMHAPGVRGEVAVVGGGNNTASSASSSSSSSAVHVFKSATSGSYYFAQWLGPGDKLAAGVKYKLVWPEEREVFVY